ncbi:hypothetical protein NDU88_006597 [Pleurodeles waltl]|uniref:Uncharacterized protein n=1 Tax=Pleurodeles waltl TaxID=8319 RepID=A0AAV7VRF4_PLEWA|nr:hypothetical protein NDU88_006597 [Pleurodeles waltl]
MTGRGCRWLLPRTLDHEDSCVDCAATVCPPAEMEEEKKANYSFWGSNQVVVCSDGMLRVSRAGPELKETIRTRLRSQNTGTESTDGGLA